MPASVPSHTTPAQAAKAQTNSVRRTCKIARKSAGSSSGSVVTITTAASTVSGSRLISGERKSRVATTTATVTSSAIWERAPAPAFTAV